MAPKGGGRSGQGKQRGNGKMLRQSRREKDQKDSTTTEREQTETRGEGAPPTRGNMVSSGSEDQKIARDARSTHQNVAVRQKVEHNRTTAPETIPGRRSSVEVDGNCLSGLDMV